MVSDKVENVRVFVDKYLYEYRVLGMKLHGWRRMENITAGLCLVLGAGGALLEYLVNGMGDMVLRTGATGAGLAILIYLVHLITDERYQLEAVQNYMVDYLENVCLHRYEKTYQKEIKVMIYADIADVVDESNVGLAGSPTYVAVSTTKEAKGAGEKLKDLTADEAVAVHLRRPKHQQLHLTL